MNKITTAKLKRVFSQYPTIKIPKGEIFIKPEDTFENLYFIKTGYVRAYTVTIKGENSLNLFRPITMISFIHFMTKHKNDFYFQALTSLELHVVSHSEFRKLLAKDPSISSLVMDFFSGSLLNLFVNQGNIINGNAQNKIASVLLQLTDDYGEQKNNKLVVNFPATHRIIANIVGLTRETTSVQMSNFQKAGVISTKRAHFTVLDLEKLKKMSILQRSTDY